CAGPLAAQALGDVLLVRLCQINRFCSENLAHAVFHADPLRFINDLSTSSLDIWRTADSVKEANSGRIVATSAVSVSGPKFALGWLNHHGRRSSPLRNRSPVSTLKTKSRSCRLSPV